MSFFLNSFAFGPLGSGFVLQVDTSRSGATPSNQFQLGLRGGTNYDFYVDWGDNSPVDVVTSSNITIVSHTYPSAGIYNISIAERGLGGFPSTSFNNTLDRQKVLNIISFGTNQFGTSWANAFDSCSAMNVIASDFATTKTQNVTSFLNTWSNCVSLSSFPPINTSNGINFIAAWGICRSLSSFPLIDTSNGTNFTYTWIDCKDLTTFPLINTSGAFTLQGAWRGCSRLSAFPLIDTSNATNLSEAWLGCVLLSSFPLIDTSKVTNFSYAWNQCVALTGFPLIDTLSGTNFEGAWQICPNLLQSDFPTLNLSNMTNGINAFQDTKLTTSSYSALLTSLCATNFNLNVPFHGGNSTFNTAGSAAKVFLTTPVVSGGRGWIINDGGYETGT
jgi:hypothetical protein